MVSDQLIDPALLGAFLDGTASADERAEVLRLAAGSEDARRVLREAVAVHEALGECTHIASSVAPTAPRQPSRAGGHFTAAHRRLAAALVGIVALHHWRLKEAPAPHHDDALQRAHAIGRSIDDDAMRMPAVRGGSAPDASSDAARAAMAGALAARFVEARHAADTVAAIQAIHGLRTLLSNVAGVAPVLARLGRAARETNEAFVAESAALLMPLRSVSGDEGCFDAGLRTSGQRAKSPEMTERCSSR